MASRVRRAAASRCGDRWDHFRGLTSPRPFTRVTPYRLRRTIRQEAPMQRFVMFRSAARCSSRSPLALGIAVLVAALALAGGSDAAGAAWTVTPVASGLDSPRGVLLTDNGTLLVAEAGHGGDSCRPSPAGPLCIGLTSQISKVNPTTGARQPLVRGLYSRAVQAEGVTGVDGLSARHGQVLATLTSYPQELAGWSCAAQPTDCANALAGARAQAGQLIARGHARRRLEAARRRRRHRLPVGSRRQPRLLAGAGERQPVRRLRCSGWRLRRRRGSEHPRLRFRRRQGHRRVCSRTAGGRLPRRHRANLRDGATRQSLRRFPSRAICGSETAVSRRPRSPWPTPAARA